MFYFTHDIGTFSQKTRFLSVEEIGVYVLMRDQYLATEAPLQSNWIALAMQPHCKESVNRVLGLFFRETDSGWACDEFDEMVELYRAQSQKKRENAKKRWGKDKAESNSNASAIQEHSNSNASAMLTNNYELITNNKELVNKKSKPKKGLEKPEDVTDQVWEDFCAQRKSLKAPLTQTALDLIKTEAEKAGISLNDALSISCSRGWRSFKAEWVQEVKNGFNAPHLEMPQPKSFEPDWDQIDYGPSRPLSEC